MAKRLASIVVALGLVGALAACSRGSEDDSLTKDQFLTEATTICNASKGRIADAAGELDPADPNALSGYIQFVSAEVLEEIEALRDLGFPDGDDRLLSQALTVYEENFEIWRDNPEAASGAADNKELVAAAKTLERYGLPSCGADL